MDSALTVSTKTLLTASAASDGVGVRSYELMVDGAPLGPEKIPAQSLVDGRIEFADALVDAGSHTVKIRANLLPYLETEEKRITVGS